MLDIHYSLQLIAIFVLQSHNLMYIHFFYNLIESVKIFFFFFWFSLLVYSCIICVSIYSYSLIISLHLHLPFILSFTLVCIFMFYILGSIHLMLCLSSLLHGTYLPLIITLLHDQNYLIMLNHVYTHEGMSHFGGGTCHNVKCSHLL